MTFKDDEKKNDSPLEPAKAPSKWANIYSSTAQSVTDVVARKVEKLQPGKEQKPDSRGKRDFKRGGKQNGQASKKNYTIGNAKFDMIGGK